jgi:hypothetical protein
MKKALIICLSIFLFASCGSKPQNIYLKYQNIIIFSDMSSRIDNKQPKDIEEIHKLVQFFRNKCVKPGKKIGDKSCITFSTFSEKVTASIDLEKIIDLGTKQRFVNSTGEYKNSGLEKQIEIFEQKVKSEYSRIRNPGLDLISSLNEKIENEPIIKQNTLAIDGIDTTYVKYDNHIYVFTDGYLEYLNKNGNTQFYFGSSEINKVRQFCIAKNVNIEKALEMNRSICLPVIKNNKNKYINLHLLETQERDKNDKLQTYDYPIGQRENEILEAVWRKWAKESGFKSFEWKKY